MKGKKAGIIFMVGIFVLTACSKSPAPPQAEIISKTIIANGNKRTDNYYWLNDRNNSKVIQYLNDENNYSAEMMKHTEGLQSKIYAEITGRIKQNDESVPYKENGYYYYTRFEQGKEYPVYCRKKGTLESAEEIILDVNLLAKGHKYYAVSGIFISPDNMKLAFGVDTVSRRKYDLFVKDLKDGNIADEKIPNTTGTVVWANDNKTVFYTLKDNTLRPYKIMKHSLGLSSAVDKMIYVETDDTFNANVSKTKSKKFIVVSSNSTLSDEYRILDADNPDKGIKVFHPREKDLKYSIDHFENKFYITTNYNAINFRLMETPLNQTGKANWKEVIPNREKVLLTGVEIFKNFLVVSEMENASAQIRIIRWKDKSERKIDFGEPVYTASVSVNPEFDSELLRYNFSSFTTPNSVYDYNMATGEKKLMKRNEVPGGYNPDNYESARLFAKATDGTIVPISIVYKKGMQKNGANPLLLYGYGSYGISTLPGFNVDRISLLDRGFIYAIAHIRGGQEMGRQWYEDGKLLKKINTFTDFIDCAKFLVNEKFTNSQKLFAMGGSAGGLLVGAVSNMAPDLFKGIIAAVPFVDVVTTMLDSSIPLTTAEYDEWGNPNKKEYYDYMLSYSPYDNVARKNYPALLVTTGLHDSQVQYFEPAKWVAKLRTMKTDSNPLLLQINMAAGHGGASGRFERYKLTALQYAFILDLCGIKD